MTARPVEQALPEETIDRLRAYLDPIISRYERSAFIERDPISIPHGFDAPLDREVIGLFSALLAWGRRDLMLRKQEELCERMRYRPYAFIREFNRTRDESALEGFVHRTFNAADALWLCLALQQVYIQHGSLDALCTRFLSEDEDNAETVIAGLSQTLLNAVPGMPRRMRKHIPSPETGSACKRLCMYFRWMVRPGPVDLGVWTSVPRRALLLPLDIHSGRQARAVGVLNRKSNDWRAVLELTRACRQLCPSDPARYDFAFFGTGEAGESLQLPDPGM